jgi:lactaldehyde dehydrogenase/glycolaldehyde dehydrogenase
VTVDFSRTPLYADGAWHESRSDDRFAVVDPTTGERVGSVPSATESEVRRATTAARSAQNAWARRPAKERGDLLREIADVLEANIESLAETLVEEQGKTRSVAEYEIEAAADIARYMSEWDRRIEGDVVPGSEPSRGSSRGTSRCRCSSGSSPPRSSPGTPPSSSRANSPR